MTIKYEGPLSDYRPRFSFDMSEEQQQRANQLLATHGLRKALMSVILDDLLDLLEEHGQVVAGLIMDKAIKPREVLPSLSYADSNARKMREK